MKTETVLFDMGGVLLDFLGSAGVPRGKLDWRGREALLRFLNLRGAGLTEDDLERALFGPWRTEYDRRHDLGREADWAEHLKRLRKLAGRGLRTPTKTLLGIWFRPLAEQVEPLPGVLEVLEELRARGHRMAIVSNVPLPGALYARLLKFWGLARFFEGSYFSYDEGHRKPSPAMVRKALSDLGTSPGAAVMIGDRRSVDIVAGRAAGVRTIWLRSDDGGGPEADVTIESMAELLQHI
jgi:HAD superfamily hydrolase (TIGR01662 family)